MINSTTTDHDVLHHHQVETMKQQTHVDLSLMKSSSASSSPLPVSNKGLMFQRRPGFGQLGTKCIVKANHFLIELSDNTDLIHYDVKIIPEVSSRGMNRAIMAELIKVHRETDLGMRLPAYDGMNSLYTAGLLPFTSKEFNVILLLKHDGTEITREREFKVIVKFVARVEIDHLCQFLAGKIADAPQDAIQVLDIVLRELPRQRHLSIGRSFYSPDIRKSRRLGDGLQSWCGFYQSVRPTQMGLSLNIDNSSAAFIEPLPVMEFVAQVLGKNILSQPLSDADRIKVKKSLRGVKVEVTHRENVRRKYRVSGLTSQTTRELMFPVDEQMNMKSVVEYFQEMYGYTIQHPHLPCLQVGNEKKANYLPMETCKIVGGQRYTKRLNDKQITSFLKVTCQRPREQEMDILQTVRQNGYDQDPYAKEFGINISDKLASLEARVLPAPWLKYHDSGKEKDCLPQVGQWNMMNKKMINGSTVNYWACINFSQSVQENTVRGFCQELAQMCQVSGMEFNREPVMPIYSARPDQVEKALKHVYDAALNKLKGKELDLLIAILPDNNGSLYGDLKRICETDLGLISQCCLTKHVFKLSKQYLANVSLKINVKMGGRNTVLLDALCWKIPLVSDIPTIIFGADVTHPETGEDSSPSIAAVVASQDWPEVTKYAGLVSAQAHRQELIQDLFKTWHDPQRGTVTGGMIRYVTKIKTLQLNTKSKELAASISVSFTPKLDHCRELLISFRKATGQKPLRIIFYRDGVSEGQFYQVLLYELDAIRKACASLEPNYQPRVTFVIVQKRHHTRLYANNHKDRSSTDKSGNILPGNNKCFNSDTLHVLFLAFSSLFIEQLCVSYAGTVVDSKICHPTEFDFYLCSHAGIQGTSRPAHYHVLWDENNFSADEIQSLTNNLCYTYARCTRSVSIVPPAYYAHLAAYRARFYMGTEVPENPKRRNTHFSPSNNGSCVRELPALKENVKKVMFYC
ncbi:hypothetical protein MKX01_018852 [Papaver californicum]|nr:hypothetical protein MKX01_018852 [Papaver californicum]